MKLGKRLRELEEFYDYSKLKIKKIEPKKKEKILTEEE